MWQRIISIIVKEFIQLSRDRRSLVMVIFIPLFQMLIFGYAVGSDIKNVSMVVWDGDSTVVLRAGPVDGGEAAWTGAHILGVVVELLRWELLTS